MMALSKNRSKPTCDIVAERVFGPVSRSTLALYAGASGDHNPIHIDLDFARLAGQPDVFAHGMLSFGVLASVATNWAGQDRLESLAVRFRSITHVGDLITCRGDVIERLEVEGRMLARLRLSATAQDGRETLSGEALIHVG